MEPLLLFLNAIYAMPPALCEHLQRVVKTRMIKKGEIILAPPKINREIYFIAKGLLRAYYDKGDKQVSSWFMKEGDVIVSITSFYAQVPTFEYIVALEDTAVFYITYDELDYIYNTFLEFNFIGRVLTTRYLILWDQIQFGLKMNSAEERYEWLIANHPEIVIRVQQNYIASWLDISDFTFSRMKSKFARGGSLHSTRTPH